MTDDQRLRIESIAYRLDISAETIERDIRNAVVANGDNQYVDDALEAVELLIAEGNNKIEPAVIWRWFTTPIPALEGHSLLRATLQDGIDTTRGYIDRIRYGDYS